MSFANKQKLELTWIGKGEDHQLEPRILIEDPTKSYGDPNSENMLIHGDNLLALKALEQDFSGKIKCIYIDPPYNTGSAFEHYDDNLEHSTWLNLMKPRLELLKLLLKKDGVILVQIDDQECHYLKVLMDEIFGRNNFISTIAVKSSTPSGLKTAHRDKTIIKQKDFILVYKGAGDIKIKPAYINKEDKWDSHFAYYFDFKTNKILKLSEVLFKEGVTDKEVPVSKLDCSEPSFKNFYLNNATSIFRTQPTLPEDIKIRSKASKDEVIKYTDDSGRMNYAVNGNRFAFLSDSMYELDDGTKDLGILLCDFWSDIDFQNTQNEGGINFPASKKPEKLIQRIFNMFTEEDDLVLDSFLGSGTTAAVAHKMGRKYIGIEMGNHSYTHCKTRLDNVVNGVDQGGISKAVKWEGGGGFKFYELAPSLLRKDSFGNWVIDEQYNALMLAAAMAKQEGFHFHPDVQLFWKQGRSTEKDFIFTTTQFITVEMLDRIHDEMQQDESLLIASKVFHEDCIGRHSNITIKKIPQVLLGRCEFGRDDYSLNIINMPGEEER